MIIADMASALGDGAMAAVLFWLVFILAVVIGVIRAVADSIKRGRNLKQLPADLRTRKDGSSDP